MRGIPGGRSSVNVHGDWWRTTAARRARGTLQCPTRFRVGRNGHAKTSILDFVGAVTDPKSAEFVPEVDRVAVFDNDGTLSTENPYTQLAFALDRAAQLGKPTTPEELKAGGMAAVLALLQLTHGSITTDEFDAVVRTWIATARHPRFGRSYAAMVYQPMVELIRLLEAQRVRVLDLLGRRCRLHARLGSGGVRNSAAPRHRQHRHRHVRGRRRRTGTAQGHRPRGARRQGAEADLDPPSGRAATDLGRREHRRRPPDVAVDRGQPAPDLQLAVHHTDAERSTPTTRIRSWDPATSDLLEAAATGDWTVIDIASDWATIYAPTS